MRRLQSVVHQHGDRHGSRATGHRGDPAGARSSDGKFHIPDQGAVRQAIHADIDDHRAGFDPRSRDQARLPGGDDQDVGTADVLPKIRGEAVAHRGGRAGEQQLQRHWAPDDVGCTDHHGILSLEWRADVLEQPDDAIGRARTHYRDALCEATDVVGMETVHVFRGIDALAPGVVWARAAVDARKLLTSTAAMVSGKRVCAHFIFMPPASIATSRCEGTLGPCMRLTQSPGSDGAHPFGHLCDLA